jgi:hypothetical protein
MDSDDEARFWSKVARAGDDECWLWTAGCFWDGYGQFKLKGKQKKAHRLSLAMSEGYSTQNVLHSCNNPKCVNPKHLRYGSQVDNMSDMFKSGRNNTPFGERHNKAKLREQDIPIIRRLCITHSQGWVGDLFGVHSETIGHIIRGHFWTHNTVVATDEEANNYLTNPVLCGRV